MCSDGVCNVECVCCVPSPGSCATGSGTVTPGIPYVFDVLGSALRNLLFLPAFL